MNCCSVYYTMRNNINKVLLFSFIVWCVSQLWLKVDYLNDSLKELAQKSHLFVNLAMQKKCVLFLCYLQVRDLFVSSHSVHTSHSFVDSGSTVLHYRVRRLHWSCTTDSFERVWSSHYLHCHPAGTDTGTAALLGLLMFICFVL